MVLRCNELGLQSALAQLRDAGRAALGVVVHDDPLSDLGLIDYEADGAA